MSMERRDIVRRDIVRRSSNPTPPDFAIGLDLGQARDYTAFCGVGTCNAKT
jgi:hypothetical protein